MRPYILKKILLIVLLSLTGTFPVKGQGALQATLPDSLRLGRLRTVIVTESAVYTVGLYFLNNIWYKNHRPVPFHFYNDYRGWMQIDKAGHMYSAYYQSYYGLKALRWAGVPRGKALLLGGTLGIILQTPIELFDGLYEGYGFSASDMIANTAGSALLIGQELLWNEQRITLKFSYSPTKYPRFRPAVFGESSIEHFFTDYNGHTYWLSANLSKLAPGVRLPKWLNIAVGMGADGMLSEFENPSYYREEPLPAFERTRQWYLSLDLDLREVPVKNKFLKIMIHALNMIKFPAPALEYNPSGNIKFHAVHF